MSAPPHLGAPHGHRSCIAPGPRLSRTIKAETMPFCYGLPRAKNLSPKCSALLPSHLVRRVLLSESLAPV
eukprot:91395-Rhodomonas_salina.2